ncbi:MAG: histidine kinase [Lachnospiraceae bacterium]|nr:histidine kinase [Lachnospiraceae bacterium]
MIKNALSNGVKLVNGVKRYKEKKQNITFESNSLARKLRIVFICMIVLFVATFVCSLFYIIRKERQENAMRESSNTLRGLSDGICSDVTRYKELSRLIMVDEGLVKYLKADDEEIDAGLINNSRYSVLAILNVTTMVDSVFFFRNDGNYLATNRGSYMFNYDRIKSEEWEYNILSKKGGTVISVNGDNALFKTSGEPIVTIGRTIYDISTQKKLGIMLMNISCDVLKQKLFNLNADNAVIVGCDGTFLSGNENILKEIDKEDYLNPEKYHNYVTGEDLTVYNEVGTLNNRRLISACKVPDMPIVIINSTHLGNGFFMYETVYVLLIVMLVYLIAAIITGAFVTKNIAAPVFMLTEALEKNREEGKLTKIDVDIPDGEIAVLKDSYNSMATRINSLFENLLEQEKLVQKAEMRVLQEQIKPHFLYNSLETISYLALEEHAENVSHAVETLGRFYRNFLSKGDREIPLRLEVMIIKDYLSLQKLRYGDILEDEYDIAEETLDFKIPKLILQPLVENSIYHGIRLKGEPGVIKISSFFKDEDLHIVIRDTGVGMTDEQISNALLKGAQVEGPILPESFGLPGTIERIRYYCGRDDVVKIRSEVGEFTEIELIINKNDNRV